MKAFKVDFSLTEKTGFTSSGLEESIRKALTEVEVKLLEFHYSFGKCSCLIEYKDFGPLSSMYHQIVLGSITSLPFDGYPYFDIHDITPQFIDLP